MELDHSSDSNFLKNYLKDSSGGIIGVELVEENCSKFYSNLVLGVWSDSGSLRKC